MAGGADRPINRRALGSIVFTERGARRDLEAIVHPEMRRRFEAIIAHETARGLAPAIVLDAAILFEAGWDSLCDLVVFVDASLPVRLDRVARDRGWTAEVLRAREAAQWPAEAKRERASISIRNDASLEALEQNVDRLLRDRDRRRRGRPALRERAAVVCRPLLRTSSGEARRTPDDGSPSSPAFNQLGSSRGFFQFHVPGSVSSMKVLAQRSLRVSIPIPEAAEASGHERPVQHGFPCWMSSGRLLPAPSPHRPAARHDH